MASSTPTPSPNNFLPVWEGLRGPKRAWFGQWDHVRPPNKPTPTSKTSRVGRLGFVEESMRWFDRYLKGMAPAAARVENDPPIEVQDNLGMWRVEEAWPPAECDTDTDAATRWVGHRPARPGRQRCLDDLGAAASRGAARRRDPLPRHGHDARRRAPTCSSIWDVAPDGTGTIVTRGAYAVKDGGGEVAFALYPEDAGPSWPAIASRCWCRAPTHVLGTCRRRASSRSRSAKPLWRSRGSSVRASASFPGARPRPSRESSARWSTRPSWPRARSRSRCRRREPDGARWP